MSRSLTNEIASALKTLRVNEWEWSIVRAHLTPPFYNPGSATDALADAHSSCACVPRGKAAAPAAAAAPSKFREDNHTYMT